MTGKKDKIYRKGGKLPSERKRKTMLEYHL